MKNHLLAGTVIDLEIEEADLQKKATTTVIVNTAETKTGEEGRSIADVPDLGQLSQLAAVTDTLRPVLALSLASCLCQSIRFSRTKNSEITSY